MYGAEYQARQGTAFSPRLVDQGALTVADDLVQEDVGAVVPAGRTDDPLPPGRPCGREVPLQPVPIFLVMWDLVAAVAEPSAIVTARTAGLGTSTSRARSAR